MKNKIIQMFMLVCCISLISATFTFAQNFSTAAVVGDEADVRPTPDIDGEVDTLDITQIRRFSLALDGYNATTNEFQRADAGPRATSGDGCVDTLDITQARRYALLLDALQPADGPMTEACVAPPPAFSIFQRGTTAQLGTPRTLRIESATGDAGMAVPVNIRVDPVGNEAGYSFRINYDRAIMTFTGTTNGNTNAGSQLCNEPGATPGQIRCVVDTFVGFNFPGSNAGIGEINPGPGANQILITLNFNIMATAVPGSNTPLTFSNAVIANDEATALPTNLTNGMVNIRNPTAAAVGVSGKVVSASGRGVYRAVVSYTDVQGNIKSVGTNQFGYFNFSDVDAGQVYVFNVSSKMYTFAPQTVSVSDSITGLNFVALN